MRKGPKKVTVVKTFEHCELYETEKGVRVSNNIYFGQLQSAGVKNPCQNIFNYIKINFDFDFQEREVDRWSTNDEKASESEISPNNEKKWPFEMMLFVALIHRLEMMNT